MKYLFLIVSSIAVSAIAGQGPKGSFVIEGAVAKRIHDKMAENKFKWYRGDFGGGRLGKVVCAWEGNPDSERSYRCEFVSE